jgi:hypothetical protein
VKLGVNPLPDRVTSVPDGPADGLRVSVATVPVKAAEMMKFAAAEPWEMSTYAWAVAGTVIVVDAGIAPAAVEVKAVPLEQDVVPVAVKHAV